MKKSAFSFVEVLITVSVIGVLASIAYVAIGDVTSVSKDQKLSSDTDALNRAVQVYLASGGSLDNAKTPADVIAKLKTAVSSADASKMIGMSSQLIDPRLSYKPAEKGVGVVWDATKNQFVAGQQGQGAVEKFILDESLAEVGPGEDTRDSAMKYASESAWIWDYSDRDLPTSITEATLIPLASAPPSTVPPMSTTTAAAAVSPPPAPTGPTPPVNGTLAPPRFSLPGGKYALQNYDLPVALTNSNPSGSSKIVYALDFGSWFDYTSPIILPPGVTLSAQSVALTSDWADSPKKDQLYDADPAKLNPPLISSSKDSFGYFSGGTIQVTMSNPNPTGTSMIQYRLNGGAWQTYTGGFNLKRNDYPSGVYIESQAISSGSSYWLSSITSTKNLNQSPIDLVGTTEGYFHNPTGGAGMITNLSALGVSESSYFDWGDDVLRVGDTRPAARSSLSLDGISFANINEGERFQIGTFDYFNGSTYAFDTLGRDTQVNTLKLGLDIAMNAGGFAIDTRFDFDLSLINTQNIEDPLNPWPDADYVRINTPVSTNQLVINGSTYEFQIEFGETTADGFSQFDEFHVLEWASASSKLYGTFREVLAP